MKKAILLAILLPLATVASVAQDNSNTILTQCRDLADAANFVGPDEVLVNGKVCKVQKTAPAKMQDPSAGNHLRNSICTCSGAPDANSIAQRLSCSRFFRSHQ